MKLYLKTYRGYANEREIVVMGHVFKKHPPDSFDLNKSWYKHAWAVIRMFRIKTVGNATVSFEFEDFQVTTKTLSDGYFRFTVPYKKVLQSGWHGFTVSVKHQETTLKNRGEFLKPYPGEYGVISDIDDTFLISHSGNIFKKLYILLTKNVDKRHVFKEVVDHYRFLNQLGQKNKTRNNAFFYVSSSEWNLYNFIIRFTQLHEFPKAVVKLKAIKTGIMDFLFTGGGNHNHKFYKIKHLVEFYPELSFILVGDDSQRDPYIYEQICKTFPKNISTVYIRQTKKKQKKEVVKTLKNLKDLKIQVCYFKGSKEAFQHSKKMLG